MEDYPIRFRDPIHGFIHLSRKELKLVESKAFRRLRNIKQLALTYLVYPGAMHTRFEHSLGVMELATRGFEALDKKSEELLENDLKKIDITVEQAKSLLRATALLHDVGHLPFSHGGEDVLPKNADGEPTEHEHYTTLRERYPKIDFILDLKAEGKVHKFFVRGDEEYGDEFPIYNTVSGQYLRLSEESSIFENIPKTFHVIRIYADVPKDRLAELRRETAEIERQERQVI